MVGFQTKDNIVASLFGTMMGIDTTPNEANRGVAAIGKMAAAMPSRTASVDCDSELHSSKIVSLPATFPVLPADG